MENPINLKHLACPHCKQRNQISHLTFDNSSTLICNLCHASFPVQNSLPILLTDPLLTSKLEKNLTAEIHNLQNNAIESTYQTWNALLTQFHAHQGSYLEIGAGNGRLSHGIIQHSSYTDITITDVSEVFVRNIMQRSNTNTGHLHFYVCDANHLPFQPNTFDVIVGRSILHHLLHYEQTLAQVYNILKPSGKAFFLEPILQGKLLVAFFLKLIVETNSRQQTSRFSPEQTQKILSLTKHLTKAYNTGNSLEELKEMEDKYIFDVVAIKTLSHNIGFQHFHYRNNSPDGMDTEKKYPLWGYRRHVFEHIKKFGVVQEQLEPFDYLFNSFGETFSNHINAQLFTPMGYFVFEK